MLGGHVASGRRYSFRAHLAAFAFLVAFPVVVLAGVLLLHFANIAGERAEARLEQLAAATSANLDREMERHLLVLNTLSTLPSFGRDWATFHDQAMRALEGDGYIVVVDTAFGQLANTYVPYGQQPARTGDPETVERVLASGRAEASDVFTSLVTRGAVINFDLPVERGGEVQYIVCYGRPVDHLTGLLRSQFLEPGWTGSVFDRRGALIASSGTATRSPVDGSRGLSRWTDQSGVTNLRASHLSEATGWTVTVDAPLSELESEINQSLQLWVWFAVGAMLIAIGLGIAFGSFLSRQLREATLHAAVVGRENAVPEHSATTLREIALIHEALQRAGAELNSRMERQRLLSSELNHRVKNLLSVVQSIVTLAFAKGAAPAQARELIIQRLQSLSRSQDLLTRADWTALPLRQVIDTELAPFAERIRYEGPEVPVSAQNVQNFGLILHELTTNAVKYGALRDGAGTIAVHWYVEGAGDDARFRFRWKEHCTPDPPGGDRRGFGSSLLRSAFRTRDSVPRLEIEPDGLLYELDVPLAAITGKAHAQDNA